MMKRRAEKSSTQDESPPCKRENISSPNTICQHCNGDLVHEEGNIICTDCGAISETTPLIDFETSDPSSNEYGKTHVSKDRNDTQSAFLPGLKYSNVCGKRESPLLTKGVLYLKEIGELLNLPRHLQEDCKKFYERAFMNLFLYARTATKMDLAGVVVYIVMRQNKIPVPISTMTSITRCSTACFGSLYKYIVENFDLNMPFIVLEDHIQSFCDKYKFSTEIKRYMIEIVPILREVFLTECSPDMVLVSLAYIGYMTVNLKLGNMKISVYKFASERAVRFSEAGKKRHRRIMEILNSLCEKLPWVTDFDKGTVYRPNVFFYIDDIIKYQHMVMNEFLISSAGFLEKEEDNEAKDESAEEKVKSEDKKEESEHEKEKAECQAENFKDKRDTSNYEGENTASTSSLLTNAKKSNEKKDKTKEDVNHTSDRRKLLFQNQNKARSAKLLHLAQPVDSKRSTVVEEESVSDGASVSHDLDDEELGEDDINDSDMMLYIKSSSEVNLDSLYMKELAHD